MGAEILKGLHMRQRYTDKGRCTLRQQPRSHLILPLMYCVLSFSFPAACINLTGPASIIEDLCVDSSSDCTQSLALLTATSSAFPLFGVQ